MHAPYERTSDYLRDYFTLLTLRLHQEVHLTRLLRGPAADDMFLGLFLSEPEIDAILASLLDSSIALGSTEFNLGAAIDHFAQSIHQRLAATITGLRQRSLAHMFDLDRHAVDVLLLALAPEVDNRFSRVYAYLQDDVARRWLTPGLALRLLPDLRAIEPGGRALFAADAPLLRHQLIAVESDPAHPHAPLIDRPIKLDDRIVEYLLEHDSIDAQLINVASLEIGGPDLGTVCVTPDTHDDLCRLVALLSAPDAPIVHFVGRRGSGKRTTAIAIAAKLGRPLLHVNLHDAARQPDTSFVPLLWRAQREARLQNAVLFLDRLDALPVEAVDVVSAALVPGTIMASATRLHLPETPEAPLTIEFSDVGYRARQQFWTARVASGGLVNHEDVCELATQFRLTPGQIHRAARLANQRLRLYQDANEASQREILFDSARQQLNPGLNRVARKVEARAAWSDLILPDAQMYQLRAITSQIRHTQTVLDDWGFGARHTLGNGLSVLFSGPSGTGKTMAAGVIARELELDMYAIDLSGVVSKYIGETEKNLSQIFEEADSANAILFFDEADALFGKRSEVKDAHDRYANIEISYLLQRMEQYDGVAILATNFAQNLDDAFTRRIGHIVEFPLPRSTDRERIWRGLIPELAPVSKDVDFGFLAENFELTGGNIRNAVTAGAFLAAEDGDAISMRHLVQGVARELGKLGRPLARADFGTYYAIARDGRR